VKTRFKKKILALFLALFLAFPPRVFSLITLPQEEKLGKKVFRLLSQKLSLVQDPELCAYITDVGKTLLEKGVKVAPFDFKFFLVKSPVFNAFSLPGGYILINTGVFEDLDSEDELAGVLAHEIAHTLRRHVAKRIESIKRLQLSTTALTIAALLLGGAQAGAVVGYTSAALAQTKLLAYSREDEREADTLGMQILVKAGYSPWGMVKLMEKLSQKGDLAVQLNYRYLLTHPLPPERVSYLTFLAQSYKGKGKKYLVSPDKTYFKRICIKARLLSTELEDLISTYKELVRIRKDPWDNYVLAMALMEARYFKEAKKALLEALKGLPDRDYFWLDLAELYLKWGRYRKALQVIRSKILKGKSTLILSALPLSPWQIQEYYVLGKALEGIEDYSQAWKVFERLKDLPALKENPGFFFAFGKVCSQLRKEGEAHFYFGRYYEITGDYSTALFHYSKALSFLSKKDKMYKEALLRIKNLKSLKE
jgi:predicted Zn-dependent protease